MKISPTSQRLLAFMLDRHPLGLAAIAPLPSYVIDGPGPKPSLITMRGLLVRGWAEERANGIYYLTESGLEAARNLKAQ